MPSASFVFNETSPSAPGAAISSKPVTGGSANYLPNGVAGPIDDYESIGVVAELTGATGGTLNVYLQNSGDQGLTWFDMIAWPTITAGASVVYYSSPLSQSTTTSTTTIVGKGASPALVAGANGAVVNGAFSSRLRLVMVAGSGTTAGASVIVRLAAQRSRLREI
jgi:hypothetical protein